MTNSPRGPRATAPAGTTLPPDAPELEASLAAVELAIATLGQTLPRRDIAAVEAAASALHEAIRAAMAQFAQAVRRGSVPAALRTRFAIANGQIAGQREALFRATSLVEQHLEILIPRPLAEASVYSATGAGQRGPGRMLAAS
jgi:hypothetical protein